MFFILCIIFMTFTHCLAYQHNQDQNPRYVAGLIALKHLQGLGFKPSQDQWAEYEAIERGCKNLDNWYMRLLIEIYTLITRDQTWKVEQLQSMQDCKEFAKAMDKLYEKYPQRNSK